MDVRVVFRLKDIAQAIDDIQALLVGRTLDDLTNDRIMRAAFERFLEVISEASRHVPDDLKNRHPQIPWRQVADMGNHLRHAYHRTDPRLLWDVYTDELRPLRAAVEALLDGSAGG